MATSSKPTLLSACVQWRSQYPPESGCPGWGPAELALNVGLICISLLNIVPFEQSVGVHELGSLHCDWATGELGKDGIISSLVMNIVALEDYPPFHFSFGIVFLQF